MKKVLVLLALALAGLIPAHAQQASAADAPFNGLITDASGKGIKARIEVKGRGFTVADKAGRFGLTNILPTDTLIVEFKDDKVVVPVGERRSMRIVWLEENPSIEEDQTLVDSGFNYIKRREYTSGSSGISGERIRKMGYTNLLDAILNLVPAVRIINGELTIRGGGSINLSNAALIICDGVPINSLEQISVYDVESVEVQKGSNMYGVRGGNGVIIVRTRSK